jgi:hypothetical protein
MMHAILTVLSYGGCVTCKVQRTSVIHLATGYPLKMTARKTVDGACPFRLTVT